MTCAICGSPPPLGSGGLCPVCERKLRALSDASSRIPATPGTEGEATQERASSAGSVAPAEAVGPVLPCRTLFELREAGGEAIRNPSAIAVGPGHELYVLDQPSRGEYRITRFDAHGEYLSTLVRCAKGEGPGQLKYPGGLAVDPYGHLCIADTGNSRLLRFVPGGEAAGEVGSQGSGPAQFESPTGIAFDGAGALYVADTGNGRVQKLTAQGVPLMAVGRGAPSNGEGNGGSEAAGYLPAAVAIAASGELFVTDPERRQISRLSADGVAAANEPAPQGALIAPSSASMSGGGRLYIGERDQPVVHLFEQTGNYIGQIRPFDSGGAPGGVSVAATHDGGVWVCHTAGNVIARIELIPSTPEAAVADPSEPMTTTGGIE